MSELNQQGYMKNKKSVSGSEASLDQRLAEIDQEIAAAQLREEAGPGGLAREVRIVSSKLEAAKEMLRGREIDLTRARLQRDDMEEHLKTCDQNVDTLRFDVARLDAVAKHSTDSAPHSSEMSVAVNFDRAIEGLRWWKKTAKSRIAAKDRVIAEIEESIYQRRQQISAIENEKRAAEEELRKVGKANDDEWSFDDRRRLAEVARG